MEYIRDMDGPVFGSGGDVGGVLNVVWILDDKTTESNLKKKNTI